MRPTLLQGIYQMFNVTNVTNGVIIEAPVRGCKIVLQLLQGQTPRIIETIKDSNRTMEIEAEVVEEEEWPE